MRRYPQGMVVLLLLLTGYLSACSILAPAPAQDHTTSDTPRNTPDPTHVTDTLQQDLAQADAILAQGRFYAALQSYTTLNQTYPDQAIVLWRLGVVQTLRGEYDEAEPLLHRALSLGLEGEPYEITLLYLSHLLLQEGLEDEAEHAWERAGPSPALAGVMLVLRGEHTLRQGDTQLAYALYREASRMPLPMDWLPLVAYRLALVEAATAPDAALATLTSFFARYGAWEETAVPTSDDLFTAITAPISLISPLIPNTTQDAGQLIAILEEDDGDERHQLLGQWYLQLGLTALAAPQFAAISPTAPNGWMAVAYAAYTRWQAGERETGLQQLEQLALDQPDIPQIGLLLVHVSLAEQRIAAAGMQLDTLETRYPDMPDVYLARATWYKAQSDYANASRAYEMALDVASVERKPTMALQAAQFFLETTYNMCESGIPLAEYAVLQTKRDGQAWTTLAALQYACRDFTGAAYAARQAVTYGGDIEATYYLGAALIALQEYQEAREVLTHAANTQQHSRWRELAEEKLGQLQ